MLRFRVPIANILPNIIKIGLGHRRMSWSWGLQPPPPESGKIIFFRAIEQFFGQRPKNESENLVHV